MAPIIRRRGGYKRSRALWDEARQKDASWLAMVRAILYELQPFRFATLLEEDWKGRAYSTYHGGKQFIMEILPSWTSKSLSFLRTSSSRKTWFYVVLGLLYCYGVKYIHRTLDAGPLVVMMSTLVVIFTIGLGDRKDGSGGMSAYSVFNRGYQQLLGSVDADALVQQHVGGAAGMAGAAALMIPPNQQQDPPPRRDHDAPVVAQRVRQQQQQRQVDNDNDGNDENHNTANNNAANNRSRRSRKKQGGQSLSRQAKQEQRQELERQRQAAREMGFGGDDESAAMQRILEEQIAANQEQNIAIQQQQE